MTSMHGAAKLPEGVLSEGGGIVTGPPLLPLREGEGVHPQRRRGVTPYEEAQLEAAVRIRRIRELVMQLDGMHPEADLASRVKLSQQIRKDERQAKVEMQSARRLALSEGRMPDFEVLLHHFNTMLDLVQEHYDGRLPVARPSGVTSARAPLASADCKHAVNQGAFLSTYSGNIAPGPGNAYNIHDDVEFLQFFNGTQKNDTAIDESLDRIYGGVQRLNENATHITSELRTQEQMLDETEQKVGDIHGNLGKLNVRLKNILKTMDRPMIIVYLLCCLILLAIIVVIYFMVKR
ncbi:syntaxin [Trypanosoma rangeli]|uniref:Syntaxin n=1 Tax=Trypanosoma rangeli TaxID=5698 RepID=A0A3R7KSJ0_TRYRA|nr:syntaxin [Trypanosoma rangeli]RNF12647.1 syntaxin [Trypanosoma rangeli]|eukprot:RNF12647.1 syntaxin [Trypanosoma rangeli]